MMEVQEKARLAQALRDNPLLRECVEDIRQAYIREFRMTASDQGAYRENCYQMLRAVDRLEQHIQEYVDSGQLEAARVKNTVKGK